MSVCRLLRSPYPTVISQQDIIITHNCSGHDSQIKSEHQSRPSRNKIYGAHSVFGEFKW